MNRKYRKVIIAGNWKMNMLPSKVKRYVEELRGAMPKFKTCNIVLCVPFPMIPNLRKATRDSRIAVGAQNVNEHEKGAYTGEVSISMLEDLNVKYVIVGHSERRQYFGETDFTVNAKVKSLLDAGIVPIICVGESLEQREFDLTMEHISYQIKAALHGLAPEQVRKCVVAYEPIWAIGTGRTATSEQAQEVCEHIRAIIRRGYGARVARSVSILYGGSMNSQNSAELLSMPDIDGGLIGGASLDPAEFARIIEATDQE
ncbi:MAG TPA: triose-phosphate isomerase [Clostridiales bacterium]|nr:triose-phosphate isomerase [Clostridiales bacterium]